MYDTFQGTSKDAELVRFCANRSPPSHEANKLLGGRLMDPT
ncbi:MAG: hypothetical protein P8K79_13110 [Mariniblastus sp.]|nr:hypothetical protein [Mariniblastus sp.]